LELLGSWKNDAKKMEKEKGLLERNWETKQKNQRC